MKADRKDFNVDCVIQAGELDNSGYRYIKNDLYVCEVAKHNVKYSEFLEWVESSDRFKREQELYRKAKERLGADYLMKYNVCAFCTLPGKE